MRKQSSSQYKLITLVLALVLISALLAACGGDKPGVIKGVVSYGDSRIADATVYLDHAEGTGSETTTDSNGQFTLENVKPGEHVVFVHWKAEGVYLADVVTVKSGEVKQVALNFK